MLQFRLSVAYIHFVLIPFETPQRLLSDLNRFNSSGLRFRMRRIPIDLSMFIYVCVFVCLFVEADCRLGTRLWVQDSAKAVLMMFHYR